MAVSFTEWVKPHLAVKPFDYSEVPRLVLAHQATFVVPRFPVARLPSIGSISWEARFPTVIRQDRQFPKAGVSTVQNGAVLRLVLSHRIQMRISDLTAKQLFSVPCPTCGVAPGERCLLHSGAPRSGPHVDRKLSAAEAMEKKRIPRGPGRQ